MKHVILYLFLSTFVVSVKAQENTFIFNHLTTKNGLSQNSAMVFYQDRLGQMWIGTRDGLNKYDGTRVTIYRKEIGNPNSISNDHILSIKEDNEGNIWIGTFNGLNRYNPKTDTFTQFYHSESLNHISNNTIWDIQKLSDGNLWIATDNGITVYKQSTKTFYRFLYQSNKIFGIRTKRFLQTKNGKLYLATTKGLLDIVDKDISSFNYKEIHSSSDYFIHDLVENKDGDLLLATKSKSIILYDVQKKTFSPYLKGTRWANKNYNVRALVFDNKNRLWAGSHDNLLVIEGEKNIKEVYPNILDKNSISKEAIRTIYKDNNNSIWIGTFFGGVNIWNATNSNFRKIVQNTLQNNLNYNLINCIEQNKNYFFFGTGAAGISITEKGTVNSRYLNVKNSKLKGNNVKALHYTKDGKLWIAIFKEGIQVYNPKTKKFEDYLLSKELLKFIKNKNIYAIKSDENQNIWLGVFGKGVIKYNTKTKHFKNI